MRILGYFKPLQFSGSYRFLVGCCPRKIRRKTAGVLVALVILCLLFPLSLRFHADWSSVELPVSESRRLIYSPGDIMASGKERKTAVIGRTPDPLPGGSGSLGGRGSSGSAIGENVPHTPQLRHLASGEKDTVGRYKLLIDAVRKLQDGDQPAADEKSKGTEHKTAVANKSTTRRRFVFGRHNNSGAHKNNDFRRVGLRAEALRQYFNRTAMVAKQSWISEQGVLRLCNKQFVGYGGGLFASFRHVVVDQSLCKSGGLGGEYVDDVIGQPEDVEYLTYQPGFWRLRCQRESEVEGEEAGGAETAAGRGDAVAGGGSGRASDGGVKGKPLSGGTNSTYADRHHGHRHKKLRAPSPQDFFNRDHHLRKWMKMVVFENETARDNAIDVLGRLATRSVDSFTVAVLRYEYVNLYHTMTDWYNAFLMMAFFNHSASDTNILLVDTHPHGTLDEVWPRLFNSTTQLLSEPGERGEAVRWRTNYTHLVWSIVGYDSPMTTMVTDAENPPLYEQFRAFFLSAYGLDPTVGSGSPLLSKDMSSGTDQLSILFVWRHDYVAHPRNPTGRVTRKIANEAAVINATKAHFPRFRINGLQLDACDMDTQLKAVTSADILIGMHGAGLTHAIFLPYGRAALIELHPSYLTSSGDHFRAIAYWRRLVYEVWTNMDGRAEVNGGDGGTIIPPSVIISLIKTVVERLRAIHNPTPPPTSTVTTTTFKNKNNNGDDGNNNNADKDSNRNPARTSTMVGVPLKPVLVHSDRAAPLGLAQLGDYAKTNFGGGRSDSNARPAPARLLVAPPAKYGQRVAQRMAFQPDPKILRKV